MLEQILKLYVMAMATGVTSPMPHLFGPPGCGKSSVLQEAARMLDVKLHVINVSRISPLELEGVQMPHSHEESSDQYLKLLPATFWTQLNDGDILLLDEFLRGFPEVYNGLLDILTAREVGGFKLPKVCIFGASNSTVAYDKALEDRLHHILVPDPRKKKSVKREIAQRIVDTLGLLPEMVDSYEMASLLDTEVLPMYDILDQVKGKGTGNTASLKGRSIRNLIGQAQLRDVTSAPLQEVLDINNSRAVLAGKFQYVFLTSGRKIDPKYHGKALALQGNSRLSEVQAINLDLNLQLIEMEKIRIEKEGTTTDDDSVFTDDPPF